MTTPHRTPEEREYMLEVLWREHEARQRAAASQRVQAVEPRRAPRQEPMVIMPGTNMNLSDPGRLPAPSRLAWSNEE
jgi:hypothetical protein